MDFLNVFNEVDDPDFFLLVTVLFFTWLQDQFENYLLEPDNSVLELELVLELVFLIWFLQTEQVFRLVLKSVVFGSGWRKPGLVLIEF